MFRIGGSANEGIVSMAQPRKNYQEGSDYQKRIEELRPIFQAAAGQGRSQNDRLSDLLISGGLNLMSARPSGNIFSTAAGAFKEPTSQYLKARETEDAFQRQINLAAATQGISSVEAERLARLKIKSGYEAQTVEAQTKEYANSLKDYEVPAIRNRRGDIAEKVVQFRTNNPGSNFVGMPNIIEQSTQTGTKLGYNLSTIPEGAVFFDPIEFQFKKRITKGIDPKTNKPILGEIYVDIQGREKTQQNIKNENVAPVQPKEIQKKGTVNPYKTYRLG